MRRHRAIENIKEHLTRAVLRIHEFMQNTDEAVAIKRLHFAPTDIESPEGEVSRVRYFSLWDSSGMRILETGQLARAERPEPNYAEIVEHGADKSIVVTMRELEMNRKKYSVARLSEIALRLENLLAPPSQKEEARR
jgi:hypothetical protein